MTPGACQVHLWTVETDRVEGERLSSYLRGLRDDERARHDAYRFEHSRRAYLIGRALVRSTLSRYADVEPGDWSFRPSARGKPRITGPIATDLCFNLSKTEGMVVCAVARGVDLGVDVEAVSRSGRRLALADRFFSPREAQVIREHEGVAREWSFLAHWTLKEAYVKARGQGLSIPLDSFAFRLVPGRPIEIDVGPDDDASRWGFCLHQAGSRHQVAVAVGRTCTAPREFEHRAIDLLVRSTVPDPWSSPP